ncbi:MAG: hypothetical protein K2G31_04300, partial [Clostridia bacterium]|nr:hypothetical protein [Clostridia bacterium]
MQKKYTLQELEELSIFDVRALAKTFGVTSPTKHNKGELVDLIYKISNGLMAPPQPPRHGRPPKSRLSFTGEQDSSSKSAEESKSVESDTAVAESKKGASEAYKPAVSGNKYERTAIRNKE